jgi:hypothetical protein
MNKKISKPKFLEAASAKCERRKEKLLTAIAYVNELGQGILKGEVSLFHWPPV